MGTPEFAVESLKTLIDNNYNVVAVVTQPDKQKVRRNQSKFHPVKEYILKENINIPILQPDNLKDEIFIKELQSYNADIFVVVAYRICQSIKHLIYTHLFYLITEEQLQLIGQ